MTYEQIKKRHVSEMKSALRGALQAADWNQSAAARAFGVSLSTFRSLLESHNLLDQASKRSNGRGRPPKSHKSV